MRMRQASKAYRQWMEGLGLGESWCGGRVAIQRTKGRKGFRIFKNKKKSKITQPTEGQGK